MIVPNLILTGSKTMSVGERTSRYDPVTYFVEALAQMAALSVSAFTDT